jgi:hypothetical protein
MARAQQVFQCLPLNGLVRGTPIGEARHHRSVRAPQSGCVRVAGIVEATAFGQLRWIRALSPRLVRRGTKDFGSHSHSPGVLEVVFCELRLDGLPRRSRRIGVGGIMLTVERLARQVLRAGRKGGQAVCNLLEFFPLSRCCP